MLNLKNIKIIIQFIVILSLFHTIYSCPKECRCIGTVRIIVYCDFRELTIPAEPIPYETTHLYYQGNKFEKIVPEFFLGRKKNNEGKWSENTYILENLKVIRFDMNPISVVNENVFRNLKNLNMIYLPRLTKIQRQALTKLKLDKETFDGFIRIPDHPLEDPNFIAFSKI